MVESSKILTVSYGTFSCTLEGFDDSFGTMKAIAEYFRDLAADDRYFGAEPPTPDAQMLAKIAEREITRRVEARTEDGEIVLRADAPPAPAMPPVSQRPDPVAAAAAAVAPQVVEPAPQMPEEFEEIADVDGATAQDTQQVAGPEAEDHSSTLVASGQATDDASMSFDDMDDASVAADPIAHHDAQSIAAKLERIRAVVGQTDAADDTPFEDDQGTALMPEIADLPDELVADHEDHAEAYEELIAAEDADEAAVEAAEIDLSDVEDADADEPGQFDMPTDPVMEAYDDEDADAFDGVEGPDLSEFLETDETPADPEQSIETAADVDIAGESDLSDDSTNHAPEPLVLGAEDAVRDDDDAILAGLDAKLAQPEDAQTEVEVDAAEVDMDEVEASAEPEVEEVEAAPAIRATVVRIPKQKAEPEAEAEDISEDDILDLAQLDGADDVDVSAAATSSSLSDDDEQELMAELAELEREYGDVPAQAEVEVEAGASEADDAAGDIAAILGGDDGADAAEADQPASKRDQLPDPDDATMSHILSQTDEALQEPEGSRRRSAIAHLKAAVVATEAARSLGDKEATVEETEEPFREDLNEVVRPKRPTRPVKPATRTERPRPAPLKLVASQRIDGEGQADAAAEPVQPRRVATAVPVVTEDEASSFAEFAEQMGATELPEMLEAAAAYTAFVEGNEDFSRPQIMQKVQSTVDEEISREDGLRYFGTLLREGRISKVRSGRFAVAEDTRYRPSA